MVGVSAGVLGNCGFQPGPPSEARGSGRTEGSRLGSRLNQNGTVFFFTCELKLACGLEIAQLSANQIPSLQCCSANHSTAWVGSGGGGWSLPLLLLGSQQPWGSVLGRRRRRRRGTMACLVAAWSVHNPTVTNSIIMVSSPPTQPLPVSRPLRSGEKMDWKVVEE